MAQDINRLTKINFGAKMEEVTKKLATEKQVENMLDLGGEKEKVVNGCHDVLMMSVGIISIVILNMVLSIVALL